MSSGKKRKKSGGWKHEAGPRGYRVTVYERKDRGGQLYARTWENGKPIKRALGEMSRGEAVDYAEAESKRLQEGAEALRGGRPTLGLIVDLYLRHRTPKKGRSARQGDDVQAEAWTRWLGRDADPFKITSAQFQGFVEARRTGAIDARGKPVPEAKRRPVRARTVEVSAGWLIVVFRWAAEWKTSEGTFLLSENPLRGEGYAVPSEKNPHRPVASTDRYEAIRAVTGDVLMEIRWGGKVRTQRSYISELLDLAMHTGRRIGAICALRFEDLRLERTDAAPHGAIRWPADTDKMGKEWTAPLNPHARAAIDRIMRERPGIAGPLFPKPTDPEKPITRYLAEKWLRAAEKLAEVQPQQGGLWHPYRRAWATARKHHPAQDVAAAGGWSTPDVVSRIYQRADTDTTLRAVLEAAELREVGT